MGAKSHRPTERELEILRVLWRNGPCSVRQVHEQVSRRQDTGYTTTLKFMQIMVQKGLLLRDPSCRSHIYTPAVDEAATKKGLVSDLVEKVFSGSASRLVMNLFSEGSVPKDELDRIRDFLEEIEKE